MSAPRQFTLSPDVDQPGWRLSEDGTQRVVTRFPSKRVATRRGALESVLGEEGGSVKIQIGNGVLEEERCFPRASDAHRASLTILDGDSGSVVLTAGVGPRLRLRSG